MHLFGTLGILTLTAGIIINIYLLVLKIFGVSIWGKPCTARSFTCYCRFSTDYNRAFCGLTNADILRISEKTPYRIKNIIQVTDKNK